MKSTNLDTIYGSPLLDWSGVEARLNQGVTQAPGTGGPDRHTCWLATINRDGSPHVTGIGGLWVDGAFWFETGEALTADYSAPSAGAPPWHVYRLQPHTATAVGTAEPFGATQWHF